MPRLPLLTPPQLWIGLALVSDGVWIWLAFLLGFYLRALAPHSLLPIDVYAGLATLCAVSYWGITAGLGGYSPSRLLSRFDEWVTVLVGLCLAFSLVLAGAFFIRSISLSRLVVGYAGLLSLLGLTITRALLRSMMGWLRAQGYGLRYVLWVGSNPLLIDVLERLDRSPQLGFEVVGQATVQGLLLHQSPPDPQALPAGVEKPIDLPIVTGLKTLGSYLLENPHITEVWFAQPELATMDRLIELQTLPSHRIQVRLLPTILAYLTVNMSLEALDGLPLVTLQDPPLSHWYNRYLKRGLDLMGSALGLICLSPLLLTIALAVKYSSPGPIVYSQDRISLRGKMFKIYKFPTMNLNAEQAGQTGWSLPNDPRRTPLGGILRRFNLDELPQLWNVFKGEMSLVGPRPERPFYVEQFSQEIPKYLDRHLVKTGLTGWAQIHGLRGDTSIARRTQYDLYYVQHWSLLLDLRILASTVWQALRGEINGY